MNPDRDSKYSSHNNYIRQMIIMSDRLVLDTYCLIGLDISNNISLLKDLFLDL